MTLYHIYYGIITMFKQVQSPRSTKKVVGCFNIYKNNKATYTSDPCYF